MPRTDRGRRAIEVAVPGEDPPEHIVVQLGKNKSSVGLSGTDALIGAEDMKRLTEAVKDRVDAHPEVAEIRISAEVDLSYQALVEGLDAIIEGSKGQGLILL
jgi:hypothetical protein